MLAMLLLSLNPYSIYASVEKIETSEYYNGIETKSANIELRNEFETDYITKIFGYKNEQFVYPTSWCQIQNKKELSRLEEMLNVDIDYENFSNKWLFISFGVEINDVRYWCDFKNYTPFLGLYQPEIDSSNIIDMNKIYVYKMNKIKLRQCWDAPLEVIYMNNAHELKKQNINVIEDFYIEDIGFVKEGRQTKKFLYDFRFLKDENNKLPRIGVYNQVSSQYEYELLKDKYGLQDFRYTSYKNKNLIVSLGAKLEGFKVYADRVEPICTGEYDENRYFIYEINNVDIDIHQGYSCATKEKLPDWLFN